MGPSAPSGPHPPPHPREGYSRIGGSGPGRPGSSLYPPPRGGYSRMGGSWRGSGVPCSGPGSRLVLCRAAGQAASWRQTGTVVWLQRGGARASSSSSALPTSSSSHAARLRGGGGAGTPSVVGGGGSGGGSRVDLVCVLTCGGGGGQPMTLDRGGACSHRGAPVGLSLFTAVESVKRRAWGSRSGLFTAVDPALPCSSSWDGRGGRRYLVCSCWRL